MATYIARDKDGSQVNIIEIMPEQIPEWEELTGLKCELPVYEEHKPDEAVEAEPEITEETEG